MSGSKGKETRYSEIFNNMVIVQDIIKGKSSLISLQHALKLDTYIRDQLV